jgi:hypothetical protein
MAHRLKEHLIHAADNDLQLEAEKFFHDKLVHLTDSSNALIMSCVYEGRKTETHSYFINEGWGTTRIQTYAESWMPFEDMQLTIRIGAASVPLFDRVVQRAIPSLTYQWPKDYEKIVDLEFRKPGTLNKDGLLHKSFIVLRPRQTHFTLEEYNPRTNYGVPQTFQIYQKENGVEIINDWMTILSSFRNHSLFSSNIL